MEDTNGFNYLVQKHYEEFRSATSQRVTDIGARKGANVRGAQEVTRRLFEATEGDATQVTDEMIADMFDEIN